MPVASLVKSRIRGLEHHVTEAATLDPSRVDDLERLAGQLDRASVVPLIGAGGSCDCGVKLAGEVAEEMYGAYARAPGFDDPPADMDLRKGDLGAVADAIYLASGRRHREVVEALGVHDASCWPSMDDLPEHFCVYRVLARLVREDLFGEALTFNYDCGFERGLKDEGFLFSPGARGTRWRDHATVVSDAETNSDVMRRGAFTLSKAHGCVERYRQLANDPNLPANATPEERIIIRWGQLLDWRSDHWVRDMLADRARCSVLLLLGFSGQDAVVHVTLTRVLQEVYANTTGTGEPRLVVIDRNPDNLALKMLVNEGCPHGSPPNTVTKVDTNGASTTAAMLVLLTNLLARRLRPYLVPANDLEGRLAEFVVALPTMLRWSFLLRQREPVPSGMQRMNYERAAVAGYVPLTADPQMTARALETRRRLRKALGFSDENLTAALELEGLVLDGSRGIAYVPVGLSAEDLRCLTMAQIDRARCRLDLPRHLEAVFVAGDGSGLMGRVVGTGAEVTIP